MGGGAADRTSPGTPTATTPRGGGPRRTVRPAAERATLPRDPVRALALTALLVALPGAAAAAPAPATDADADFEPEHGPHSIAVGPLPSGSPALSLDLGWLRSGLQLDVGLLGNLDLVLRADGMLLYDGLRGQDGFHLGLRFTPVGGEGGFRLGTELTFGEVLIPAPSEMVHMTTVRGEVILGAVFDLLNVYARLAVRGVDSGVAAVGWQRDEEVGLGVERALFGHWVLAAEGYAWARPNHSGLGQWRIRVGFFP